MLEQRRLLVAVTGASGSIYAQRLVECALMQFPRIYLVFTDSGRQVLNYEMQKHRRQEGFSLVDAAAGKIAEPYREQIRNIDVGDLFAPVASGTSAPTDMVVVPCSMGTLGRIAHGLSTNLLERAADVVIKERRRLVLVPRETPLSVIHLENLLAVARAGAIIVPPAPGFYHHPTTFEELVDFTVGKILDALDVPHELTERWNVRRI